MLSVSTWLTIVVFGSSYALFGHVLLTAIYGGEVSETWMTHILDRADRVAGGVLVLSVTSWCSFALVRLWAMRRWNWWILAGGLLVLYVGAETLVAPLLEDQLGLARFYLVRDPDHWPGPGMSPYAEMGGMNSDWVRTPLERADFEAHGLNIVFLGDSFTYGFGVPREASFPALVESALRGRFPTACVSVANFGWISSSPVLSLRRLSHMGDGYNPDLVVLCIDMSDFHDDIKWRNMLARRGVYRVFDRIPITLKVLETWLPGLFRVICHASLDNQPEKRFFVTEEPLEKSRPYLAAIVESIDAIEEHCRQHGWRFVLFVLPRGYQYSDAESPRNWEGWQYEPLGPHCLEPFRFFAELGSRVPYPVHSLLPAFGESSEFPTCFEGDPHWNEVGHRIAAAAIAELLVPELEALLGER